jgi:hypothetical protein
MNFADWWSPGATEEAAHDASVANLLWKDVEKRRKNAWLRKVGFITRIFLYACCFGVLFIFMPEGVREGWITTKPFSALNLGDVLGALVWLLIGMKLFHALFKPNPRPDFREALGWFGVALIGVVALAGVVLHFFS